MDYSLPLVLIVPTGNTPPTSGTTATLTPGQTGVFNQLGVAVTAGTAPAAKYLFVAQGQPNDEKSLKSDKIFAKNVIKMTKIIAEDTARLEIWQISDLVAHCGEQISLSFRLSSNYINTSFYNGLTASVTVSTPCCACDGDPCEVLTGPELQALADELVAKVNDPKRNWFNFISASRTGSGATSSILISAKPITQEGNVCDLRANPFEYDAVSMHVWIYKGMPTTQDNQVYGPQDCESVGTVEKIQSLTYTRGSWQMVQQVEKENASYRQAAWGTLYRNPNFNGWFQSEVVVGTYYDEYLIKFRSNDGPFTWASYVDQDSTIRLFVPTTSGATLESILEAGLLQSFEEVSGPNISTTTSTSTSSTTSTTTTL